MLSIKSQFAACLKLRLCSFNAKCSKQVREVTHLHVPISRFILARHQCDHHHPKAILTPSPSLKVHWPDSRMESHPRVFPMLMPKRRSSFLLSLDALVVKLLVFAASLDGLLGLALLGGSVGLVVIVVLGGSLLTALLGSGLGLGRSERGVCSRIKVIVSNLQLPSLHVWAKQLTAALALSRSQGSELLLDHTPGVRSGLGGVKVRGDTQLLDVDFRRGLEAVPGRLENALFLLSEEHLVGLGRGGFLDGRGRHGCWRWWVVGR
jgi:hypothetical protein